MEKIISPLVASVLCFSLFSVVAQVPPGGGMSGPPAGPQFGGDLAKIFGANSAFSADLEVHTTGGAAGDGISMPGKFVYLDGKSRFEMDLTQMKSSKLPASAAAQMKMMGMDQMVTISRPDKKATYLVYPNLQSYIENPVRDPDAATPEADYKVVTTEIGKETLDGHDCVKNQVTITGKDGKAHVSTVWNASDLKKFPIKIENIEAGATVTMLYKNLSFSKPDAAQFEPPADYKKYDDLMSMMMKTLGGGIKIPQRDF